MRGHARITCLSLKLDLTQQITFCCNAVNLHSSHFSNDTKGILHQCALFNWKMQSCWAVLATFLPPAVILKVRYSLFEASGRYMST